MISPLGTIPVPAETEKLSPVNVPPSSGVKTSYCLPPESISIAGISPSGLRGGASGPVASPGRRTVIRNVAVQAKPVPTHPDLGETVTL